MALIEGIGDEVLHFFIILFLLAIAVTAWWSTRISERPFVRTVLILERHAPRQASREAPPAPSVPPPDEADKPDEVEPSETNAEANAEAPVQATVEVIEAQHELARALEASEEVISVRPDQVSTLRNRRLAFFDDAAQVSSSSNVLSHNAALKDIMNEGSQPQPSQSDLPSAPVEEEVLTASEHESVQNPLPTAEDSSSPLAEGAPSIRIRLKYLNDDLKLVEGSLEELLGDFKKRHFSLELSARKLVRLIFNGQVLGQDTRTLRHYGLFDNCVVHCLVHQPRTPPPSPNLSARPAPLSPWALSNILLASLSLLLAVAWYGRYQYAQLYTATTTVALVGLTGIFTVSLIGIYMPEPTHA